MNRVYDTAGYLVKRLQAALRAHLDKALAPCGVTMPQYAALAALERNPGISNADLARTSFVTPQTMIRILSGLEARGLVTRSPHPNHGRALQIVLTAEGEKVVSACHGVVLPVDQLMVEKLSEKEHKELIRLMKECIHSLE